MSYRVGALGIHKCVLMAVVATGAESGDAHAEALDFACRRLGAGQEKRQPWVAWRQQPGVTEVVLESRAQYWRPIGLELEPAP